MDQKKLMLFMMLTDWMINSAAAMLRKLDNMTEEELDEAIAVQQERKRELDAWLFS